MKIISYTLIIFSCLLFGYAIADSYSLNKVDSHMETATQSGQPLTIMKAGFTYDGSTLMNPSSHSASWNIARVPEPATLFLLGSGLIGLSTTVRRKIKSS